jgi:hypothetical protein
MRWADLVSISSTDEGPFADHLRHYLWRLHDIPELVTTMRHIIQDSRCLDDMAFYRLKRAGLVKGHSEACNCRCQLYEIYFGKKLL